MKKDKWVQVYKTKTTYRAEIVKQVLKLNDIISSKVVQISENSNSLLAFYAISLELSSINTIKEL